MVLQAESKKRDDGPRTLLQIVLTDEEKDAIREAAERDKRSMSNWSLLVLLRAAKEQQAA